MSAPGTLTPEAALVKPIQPGFTASCHEASAHTKDEGDSTHPVPIYVDEDVVNIAEATTSG